MFFYWRQKAVLICWTMGQQAFNACMILILDAWETGNAHNEFWINQAYSVFVELYNRGVHKLAELAVQRISSGLMMLEERRRERSQNLMSLSRRQSHQTGLQLDTASMTDFSGDAVMGNTGMFLLEDPGSQFYHLQPATSTFRPLEWMMPNSAHASDPPTPNIPSPAIPVSDITAVPFPVLSPPTIPVTNAPFALGLQPRMPTPRGRMSSSQSRHSSYSHELPSNMADFTAVNTMQQAQQPFPQQRGPVRQSNGGRSNQSSGTGSRSTAHGVNGHGQRLEKVGKSHRRR
jgi:hypothetical protein